MLQKQTLIIVQAVLLLFLIAVGIYMYQYSLEKYGGSAVPPQEASRYEDIAYKVGLASSYILFGLIVIGLALWLSGRIRRVVWAR